MPRRGSEAGPPSNKLGKRKTTAEIATPDSSRKLTKGESSGGSQQQKPAKRSNKKGGKKQPKTRLLNAGEREEVVDCIVEEDVLSYVLKEIPSKLIGDLFPERRVFWLSLLPEKIKSLVHSAVIKYLTLYKDCGQIKDKAAALYMKWLQYERTLVCKSMKTSESILDMYKESVGDVNEETIRTVVTLIMNTVYKGVVKQMADKIEHTFSTYTTTKDGSSTSPSDDVALHRICGWALKSVINKVTEQSKQQSSDQQVTDTLELLKALKLPNNEKIHLPDALQYLDRGGLTFMLDTFLPWMRTLEERMVLNLNSSCYQRYGEKLFEVGIVVVQ